MLKLKRVKYSFVYSRSSIVGTRMSYVTTVLPAARRRQCSYYNPSSSWYSIYWWQRDDRLIWPGQVDANILLKEIPWWSVHHSGTWILGGSEALSFFLNLQPIMCPATSPTMFFSWWCWLPIERGFLCEEIKRKTTNIFATRRSDSILSVFVVVSWSEETLLEPTKKR